MKNSIATIFVILEIVMSFFAVQGVCGIDTITVSGHITAISAQPFRITVAGCDIFGVKPNYLKKQFDIDLANDLFVNVKVYVQVCSTAPINKKFIAYEITAKNSYGQAKTVRLRDVPKK